MNADTTSRVLKSHWAILSMAALALLVGFANYVLSQTTCAWIFDDAFMFTRYAHNFWNGHGLSWNIADGPAYGCTSFAYLLLTIVLKPLFAEDAVLLTFLSAGGAFLMFAALARLVVLGRPARPALMWFCLLVVPSFAFSPYVFRAQATGMETTVAVALFALWLFAFHRSAENTTAKGRLALGAMVGPLFWVRPEFAGMGLVFLAVQAVGNPAPARGSFRQALVASVFSLALVLVLNRLMFGTALPLPFYAKAAGSMEEFRVVSYRPLRFEYLKSFLKTTEGPFLCLLFLALKPGRFRALPLSVKTGVALALGFVAYEFFGVLPIMGDGGRFYWPALPLLYLAAGYAMPASETSKTGVVVRKAATYGAALVLVWFVGLIGVRWKRGLLYPTSFDATDNFRQHQAIYWYGLDRFSTIDKNLKFATTEVGHVGEMDPDNPVLDLAGLNDRKVMAKPKEIDRRLREFAPDLVYMPHPDYVGLLRRIRTDADFQKHYRLYESDQVGGSPMPIALRKDSPYYRRMSEILRGPHAAR